MLELAAPAAESVTDAIENDVKVSTLCALLDGSVADTDEMGGVEDAVVDSGVSEAMSVELPS
jgi:hypothetical protein